MKRCTVTAVFVSVMWLSAVGLSAAQVAAHEVTSEVPALAAMHEVIYPLWHEAWPAKDTKKMAELLPTIEKLVGDVVRAELPGILRDKKAAWGALVDRLKADVQDYKAAVAGGNNEALLKAAESLHMNYEKLVRVVRPASPEVDAFHQSLYVLYHYDLPKFSLPKVRETVATLKTKMAALDKAAVPARIKAKSDAYVAARTKLSQSVTALAEVVAGSDQARIKAAIEAVHADYGAFDKLFQ